ncbi:MAG TPA: lipid A deacylase LpxR family protein, partial [Thermoanaerobaculia bacterium]|nr:lipid A deacylase LpxR family protein [Thermoanaerobaculia bacterium]
FAGLVVVASGCAHVQKVFDGQPAGVADKSAGFFFQEENDSIAPGNRDKYYTQGLRWAKTFNPDANPRVIKAIDEKFATTIFRNFRHKAIWSSGIAQTMYTPDDITISAPQPHDRPWAGFIYLDNTMRFINKGEPKVQHVFELQTGVIGPYSGAKWAQSALHALIGSPHPLPGWRNQISTRPGVEAIYLYNRRWGNSHIDFLPFAGGAAGNTMVYANAGAHVRLGWNLAGFFNTGAMQGTFAVSGGTRPPFEAWVYGGVNGSAIPYNLFLSKGDIDPKKFVYDRMAGASVRYRSYRLTYNIVRRSREFTHPLAPNFSSHDYGSVVLSYELIIKPN